MNLNLQAPKNEIFFISSKSQVQTQHNYKIFNARNFSKTIKINVIKNIFIPAHGIAMPKNRKSTMNDFQKKKKNLEQHRKKWKKQFKKMCFELSPQYITISSSRNFLYLEIWTDNNWGGNINDSKLTNGYVIIMI